MGYEYIRRPLRPSSWMTAADRADSVIAAGAKGDGITDDTVAVQQRLTARRAYLPMGVYNVGGLTLPPGVAITADRGAVIRRANGYRGVLLSTAAPVADVSIAGLKFDNNASPDTVISFANGSKRVQISSAFFSVYGGATSVTTGGGAVLNASIDIENCWFEGDGTGSNIATLFLINPDALKVSGCRFDGAGAVSIATSSGAAGVSRDIQVIDNRIRNQDASGILIRPNGDTFMENIVVSGNTGENLGTTLGKGLVVVGERVGGSAGSGGAVRNVVISGNAVKNFGAANGIAICVGGGVNPIPIYGVTVTGNAVDGSDRGQQLAQTKATQGIAINNAIGFQVSGNTVRYVGRAGIRITGSLTASDSGARFGAITGNTVEHAVNATGYTSPTDASECGIALFTKTRDITITGNVVRNTGVADAGMAGIGSDLAPHDGIMVQGNRCFDDRPTKFQRYGVRVGTGGPDAAQPTNWTIDGNDLRGNGVGGYVAFNTTEKGHRVGSNLGV